MLEVIAAATVLVIVIGTVYRVYRITPKEIATLAEDGWEVVNEGTYSRLYGLAYSLFSWVSRYTKVISVLVVVIAI